MCLCIGPACKDVSSSVRWPLYKLMYFTRVYGTLNSVCTCVYLCIGPRAWMDVSSGADVSSSVRWPLYKLMYFTRVYATLNSVCTCVLALVYWPSCLDGCVIRCQQPVKMCHLLSGGKLTRVCCYFK